MVMPAFIALGSLMLGIRILYRSITVVAIQRCPLYTPTRPRPACPFPFILVIRHESFQTPTYRGLVDDASAISTTKCITFAGISRCTWVYIPVIHSVNPSEPLDDTILIRSNQYGSHVTTVSKVCFRVFMSKSTSIKGVRIQGRHATKPDTFPWPRTLQDWIMPEPAPNP